MFSILTQEFRSSLPLDNGLLIADVKNGVPISEKEIVEVAINARTLFVVSTLACRELEKIDACFELWTETRDLLAELLDSWSKIPADNYPRVAWLLTELKRLQALAEDRCELYCVSAADRRRYVEMIQGDSDVESYKKRNDLEPKGEHNSTPQHVYSIGHF